MNYNNSDILVKDRPKKKKFDGIPKNNKKDCKMSNQIGTKISDEIEIQF